MSHIPAFGKSGMFRDYLIRDMELRKKSGVEQHQEDAGQYLMDVLKNERWAMKIWGRECGVRFIEWRKSLTESSKWTFKRWMMEREPLLFVYPQPEVALSTCVKNSLRVETSEIILYKRLQHPPPRYLVLNFTGKVSSPTPCSYFDTLEFSPTVKYRAMGFILHLGPADGLGGHYIYVTAEGFIFDDLNTEVKRLSDMNSLTFHPLVSPSIVIYRRTTRRKNPKITCMQRTCGQSPVPVEPSSSEPDRRISQEPPEPSSSERS